MPTNIELGRQGEKLCSLFLCSHGWNILERNLKSPFGEVDIICERQGCLWAVEVKTRSTAQATWMQGIVTHAQTQRIARALRWYVNEDPALCGQSLGIYCALVNISAQTIQLFQLIR